MSFLIPIIAMVQSAATSPLFEIPLEFRGEYNETLADCGTGNNDSRLRISWDRVHFWESTGELNELLRLPDGSIVIVAKTAGEGEQWDSVYQLRLSDDGDTLTVVNPQTDQMDQLTFHRHRCPPRTSE